MIHVPHVTGASTAASVLLGLALASASALHGQSTELLPGDPRLDPSAIEDHEATHRFIQYRDGTETEVGRLWRRVERVHHTANEPAILVSMQFRSPTRSGLDILYLDASTLSTLVRYLTSPLGMITMFQTSRSLHVTFARRDGGRVTADTTLAYDWFAGATDLVLASLDAEAGDTFGIPQVNGAAQTLAAGLEIHDVGLEGVESVDIPGVWSGMTRRFVGTRPDGTVITYWIAAEAPHLIRQDFATAEGTRFLRWELTEHHQIGGG